MFVGRVRRERWHWFSAFEGLQPPLAYYAPSGLEKCLAFVEGLHPSLMYFALSGLVGIKLIGRDYQI
jgi:hypothetical protein